MAGSCLLCIAAWRMAELHGKGASYSLISFHGIIKQI